MNSKGKDQIVGGQNEKLKIELETTIQNASKEEKHRRLTLYLHKLCNDLIK